MSSPPPGLTFGHTSSRGSGSPVPFSPDAEKPSPQARLGIDPIAALTAKLDLNERVIRSPFPLVRSTGSTEKKTPLPTPIAPPSSVNHQSQLVGSQSSSPHGRSVSMGYSHQPAPVPISFQYLQQMQGQAGSQTALPQDNFAAFQRGVPLRAVSVSQPLREASYPSAPAFAPQGTSFQRGTPTDGSQFSSLPAFSQQMPRSVPFPAGGPGILPPPGPAVSALFANAGKNEASNIPADSQQPRFPPQQAAQKRPPSFFPAGPNMGFQPSSVPPCSGPWPVSGIDFPLGPAFVPVGTPISSSASSFPSGGVIMTPGAQQLHHMQLQLQLQQLQPSRQAALAYQHKQEREQDKEFQAPVLALSQSDTEKAFGYCLDRGNGKFTRLIPADILPPMKEIPPTGDYSLGLVVLPALTGTPPSGQLSMNQMVTMVDSSTKSQQTSGQKRTKIYCDKWVHEGVCAFTQQGCKFKHEMPMDKETQNSLGLFHGLPIWWKRSQAEFQRLSQVAAGTDSESASSTTAVSDATSSPTASVSRGQTSGPGDRHASPAYTRTAWRSTTPGSQSSGSSGFSSGTATTFRPARAGGSSTARNSDVTLSTGESNGVSGVGRQPASAAAMTRVQPRSAVISFYQPRTGTPTAAGSSSVWGPVAPSAKTQNDA